MCLNVFCFFYFLAGNLFPLICMNYLYCQFMKTLMELLSNVALFICLLGVLSNEVLVFYMGML